MCEVFDVKTKETLGYEVVGYYTDEVYFEITKEQCEQYCKENDMYISSIN